jgi:uncharacterized membrane protein
MGGNHKGGSIAERRYRLLVILIILLLAISIVQSFAFSSMAYTRSTRALNDVNLYFHRGETLDTVPPSAATPDTYLLNDGEQAKFVLENTLGGDLQIQGKDVTGGKGFWMYLSITIQNGTLMVTIFDDALELATTTLDSSYQTSDQIHIPFKEVGKTSHTFASMSSIEVVFEATTAALPVALTYDASTIAGHLVLTCDQMVIANETLKIKDSLGDETDTFTPNHPTQEKLIKFEGEFRDVLGYNDVKQVKMEVYDPNYVMVHENLTTLSHDAADDTNCTVIFKYDWEYESGLGAGEYTAQAVIEDQSGNNFTTSDKFSFSSYGVYLYCKDTDKTGAIGKTVTFPVRVYNTGGSQDTIQMSSETTEGWNVAVDKPSFVVPAGDHKDLNITVSVPDTAQPKDSERVYLRGRSDTSADTYDEISLSITAVSSYDFEFTIQGDSSATIAPGSSKDFSVKLKNIGEDADDYLFYLDTAPPGGWTVSMSAPGATNVSGSSKYLEYQVTVAAGDSVMITTTVSIGDEPSATAADIVVKATSRNDPYQTENTATFSVTTVIDWTDYVVFKNEEKQKTATISNAASMAFSPVTFQISITNIESRSINVQMSVEMDEPWTSSVGPSSFTLSASEQREISVTINPTNGAQAGPYPFTVYVREAEAATLAQLNGKIDIPQIHNFQWHISKNNLTIDEVGGEVEFTVKIFNRGNVLTESVEIVIIEESENEGFEVTLEEDARQSIGRNNNQTLHVQVKAKEEVPLSSSLKFKLAVNGTDFESRTMTVNTDIDPLYLTFFLEFAWVPIALMVVIVMGLYLRYKQLS